MHHQELIPHLFRTEFRKITAVLAGRFGIGFLENAEDIASETFLLAFETWPYKGTPENPTAWLHAVAKNKANNFFHRNEILQKKIIPELTKTGSEKMEIDIDLSEQNIADSQLQMLFAVCHPSLSLESQVGLALRILCGFGIEEIAVAFLTNREVINKRLYRAREKLRDEKIRIELPGPDEIAKRLDAVLTTIYLLFSEGYFSESGDQVIKEKLCLEAMRLNMQLIGNELTNLPRVNALMSLMCFQSSRFAARRNEQEEIILYQEQDESLWNRELIAQGAYFLKLASIGNELSRFHLEAGIAFWYTVKEDSAEKWESILQLYNRLLQLSYSPIAALNRTYALSKVYGKVRAIIEAERLVLNDNRYYFLLLGELYKDINDRVADGHFRQAYHLAKSDIERRAIQSHLDKLSNMGKV